MRAESQRFAQRRTFQVLACDIRAAHRQCDGAQAYEFAALRTIVVGYAPRPRFSASHTSAMRLGLQKASQRKQIVHGVVA